jgi:hypothetical protein
MRLDKTEAGHNAPGFRTVYRIRREKGDWPTGRNLAPALRL